MTTAPATLTILILEDEIEFREQLGRWINLRYPGARVLGAESVSEALAFADAATLIISDILLPGEGTGIDFWRECRHACPETPFLFISGLPLDFYLRIEGAESGRTPDFLTKPFTSGEFRQIVDRLLHEAEGL